MGQGLQLYPFFLNKIICADKLIPDTDILLVIKAIDSLQD